LGDLFIPHHIRVEIQTDNIFRGIAGLESQSRAKINLNLINEAVNGVVVILYWPLVAQCS